ncbi:hypothetical protein HFP48_21505 [Rhodococcus sp. DMU1]|nr:hypothetical protein HFP48_21505 [Rhodococcus sp. DMU1]
MLDHAWGRWSPLRGIDARFRGAFAHFDGTLADDTVLPLTLRNLGSAHSWGFAIYLACNGKDQDSVLSTGRPSGSPDRAFDCACGLYPADPIAWHNPRRTSD